jgi:hypothetical protein
MNIRSFLAGALVSSALVAVVACAQSGYNGGGSEPALNVSPELHGNIARAQEYTRQAYDAMTAAQQANEYDMGGHASNAKNLLRQAAEEMKASALTANRNRR